MWLPRFLRKRKAQLVVTLSGSPGRDVQLIYTISEQKIEIGRGERPREEENPYINKRDSRLVISPLPLFRVISRKHATLEWDPTAYRYIFQDHSTAGSIVAGTALHHASRSLNDKDQFVIGHFHFQILY